MNNDVRWKQRFQNFDKSFAVFQRRLDDYEKDSDSESHQMSLIQSFELIFELAWNVLRDYLENDGTDVRATPKIVFKEAFKAGLIREGETWLESSNKRNKSTHIYDEKVMNEIIEFIQNDFYPLVRDLYFDLKKEI